MADILDPSMMSLAAGIYAVLTRPVLRAPGTDGSTDAARAAQAAGCTVTCLVDADDRVFSITPNASHVLGEACERAPELGLTLAGLLQPEDRSTLDAWLGRARLSSRAEVCRLPARSPDGGVRWLELLSPGRRADGLPQALIIEIRATEPGAALRIEQPQLLAAALHCAADAVAVIDGDGRMLYLNAAFERHTGVPAAAALGRTLLLLCGGRARAEVLEPLWRALGAGNAYAGELALVRPDGTPYTLEVSATRIAAEDGTPPIFVVTGRDVTDRLRTEHEIEDAAYYDHLTGVANRRLLHERARQTLAMARRHGSIAALVHIDIVHLRAVNLQHGRQVGDEVLRSVAERLKQGLRESDTLARTAGDEFQVLLGEVSEPDAVARVVARLHDAVTRPFRVGEVTVDLSARAGVALYPQDAGTYEELLDCASQALQRAEHVGSEFEFFERDQGLATRDRMALEEDLRWAWEHNQFVLHYQPIVGADGVVAGAEALTRGNVVGLEALARVPHLERGLIGPAQFIELAERTGRILSLDRWAIATAARQAVSWTDAGFRGWVSVNLSARTLHDPDLPEYTRRTLDAHGLQPGRLVVEITESTAMRDPVLTGRVLRELSEIGVRVALDDFGVGHSSLSYLRQFPVDLLKLDASFIDGIGRGDREEHLIEMMVSLAHRFGARVVAEGVEEVQQMEWLRTVGCDYVQGYLVGRPAPPEALTGPRPVR